MKLASVYNTVGLILLIAAVSSLEASAQSVTSCASLAGENPDRPFVVVGRVVDENGRPKKGSSVSIDPRGNTEMLNPYESASSDENGCFRFVGFGDKRAQKTEWFLYTSGRFGLPGIAYIYPPFVGHLRSIDSQYNGIPFVPGERRVVDMGDVPVVFRYGSARLRFDDCSENKCSSSIQWGTAGVSIVHCNSQKWVERSNFSLEQQEKYFENKDADLIFMLPMGRWKVQFYDGYESFRKDELVAETACFDVKLNEVFDVPVKLTRTSRR
jgi:hypothetical protein